MTEQPSPTPLREPTSTDPATNYAHGWTDGWNAHKAQSLADSATGPLDVERLDDMEGALHYALGHMSDDCDCDRIWADIRHFHSSNVEPLPAYNARLASQSSGASEGEE